MTAPRRARRVQYDLFWGAILLATCLMPARLADRSYLWHLLVDTRGWVQGWLIAGVAAPLFALAAGLTGWRGRWRHFVNFCFGTALLSMPMVAPEIWREFPLANPATLPLGGLGTVGWVVLVALTAIYAGSGIRVVRPSQITGQALGALGALLLLMFTFLPMADSDTSYGMTRIRLMGEFRTLWRELTPFLLVSAAALCGICNLVRSRWEVPLAKLTRLLMVSGLMFWLALPFLEKGGTSLKTHVPVAWGALKSIGPLFLSLDGCVAFVAISITRSEE
jgi:hypothetical protein